MIRPSPSSPAVLAMWDRYRTFLEAPPHVTLEWHDPPTGARGWLVVNSLRGGASGGGTRMREGLTREEVVYLAKAMEMKFTFSGPRIGGAKSGIDFDPADPRRREVLARWFRAIRPFLATCYGTGGDVAVDEQEDVEPLCRELGLEHPQEGVVRGHLGAEGDEEVRRAFRVLREGVRMPVQEGTLGVQGRTMVVSDLITGWGVALATRRSLERRGDGIRDKRVVVEGFGNVGAACALYLARMGARIVAIVDAESSLVSPRGLEADQVEDLVVRARDRLIPEHPLRRRGQEREDAYLVEAEIFVPAAVSRSIGRHRLDMLEASGVDAIVCGANQPFAEDRLGDVEVQRDADERFTVVPDVVASMGMAVAFHHFMRQGVEGVEPRGPEEVFGAVRRTVEDAVDRVVERSGHGGRGILAAAVDLALTE